ncbi:MAG: ribosome biogenesis/translation initiation ATPase RLI [Candidatus Aenigmatarchaeota archaeon]
MRIAIIDYEKCKPESCGKECESFCPRVRAGDETVKFGENGKPVIDEGSCIGCGICVKKCPRDAIKIVNTPEQLNEQPLYRFGKNSFALFRLPFPVKGEVVGLLGQNGLGKTSALKILTGDIKLVQTHESLARMFRGTELQEYLEKMFLKKLKTVLKPQMLFSNSKSIVSDVLQKSDERGMMKEIVGALELQSFLDRKIENLSGGELQRLAIASAALRKADVYYFDEPSSFLDARQRINAAKIIRSLAKDAAVMVVEHDLASLDFLADKIHIFYGEPGCYGIVSKPYGVRVGINAFLDGFIREDNVRIHEPVDFSFTKNVEQTERYLEFGELKKKLDGFSLIVEGGEIRKKEIIGIFGANGLGKTTFARILAGEIKPDAGEVEGISISYKPQYLSSEFDGTVLELLESTVRLSDDFKSAVLRPLGIDGLFENSVKNLSGGEMQRLAIALCLGKEADLYLLDEPSAYLDSMQRMVAAKIIRRIAEKSAAVVIDHDLLFLNYISDRAMLFTGESGKSGFAKQCNLADGMNEFLKTLDITFRKEKETGRPRANKPGSQKDEEQKAKGNYFLG